MQTMGDIDQATFLSIPVLDFALTSSRATKPAFLSELRNALVNVGFFYLKNGPVSKQTRDNFVTKSIELFSLPLEKKLDIDMVYSKHFLGYSRLGAEITAQEQDFREQFDFATELPAPAPDEPLYRNLRGPNQWPDESAIPGFRDAVEAYLSEIAQLADAFKTLIAEALDLEPSALHGFFDELHQNKLKLIRYPPPSTVTSVDSADVQGVGPHKDSCFLTYLLQATPHTGLEVQNKGGAWIPAPPIPDTLVINIGRALEALTHGVCTATTHRVRLRHENFTDEAGISLGSRFSFPIFQGISLDLTADKIALQLPAHIEALVRDKHVRSDAEATFNEMFKGHIGEGTFIARVTSHQDVAKRWYPQLLIRALEDQKKFRVPQTAY